jgi:sulfide:quinone oxidoreductase
MTIVCIVGAGTAGLEGLLSARNQLGGEPELVLIAPEREFRYRPMSRDSLFRPAAERSLAVADVVAQAAATWVEDRAQAVREAESTVLTRDGDTVVFDFLLLAVGGRPMRALRRGYVWVRGGDPRFLDQILQGIASGEVRSVGVVVPRGARWPIPAYELALILAWSAAPAAARVTLLTVEEQPMGMLGAKATKTVASQLDAAGVEVKTGVEVADDPGFDVEGSAAVEVTALPEQSADEVDALVGRPSDPARVRVGGVTRRQFDRLISLPTVAGPFLAGTPHDDAGFIEVDETLKACGSKRVWAAGGCIASALEHSALSAQQADAAISAIAAAVGAGSSGLLSAPEVTGILLSGQRDRWLLENPVGTREPSTRSLWWPSGRAVGRALAQCIAAWDPSTQPELPGHPGGTIVRVPVALGCSEHGFVDSSAESSAAVRHARVRDIENRQLMAVQRRERAGDEELSALGAELQAFTAREHAVIHELQQHGYLQHRDQHSATSRPASRA